MVPLFAHRRHFAAPWQYDGDRGDAIRQLTAVATGGAFTGGDARESISRLDAAGYILGGVAAVVQGVRRTKGAFCHGLHPCRTRGVAWSLLLRLEAAGSFEGQWAACRLIFSYADNRSVHA